MRAHFEKLNKQFKELYNEAHKVPGAAEDIKKVSMQAWELYVAMLNCLDDAFFLMPKLIEAFPAIDYSQVSDPNDPGTPGV